MPNPAPILVLRHVPEEALGNLEIRLVAAGAALRVVDCFAENWPAVDRAGFDPADYAGLVVMGGPMNADQVDAYPFLHTEVKWLRCALHAELPTLGICLGAQLLAKAAGGHVYPQSIKEIGWYPIELSPAAATDPLLEGSQGSHTVFEWHGDTFNLPAGATLLASSRLCVHQAFRCGPCAWGLQFHPEMTLEMVHDWLVDPGMCAEISALDYIDSQEIRRRAPEALASVQGLVEQIFGRFAAICNAQGSPSTGPY